MNGLVVTIDFKLKPSEMAAFRKLIDENAPMRTGVRALRRARIQKANDRIFTKSVIAARLRYSLAVAASRHIQHDEAPT